MPYGTAMIYCYDGSFDGLLTCVFESFEKKETPMDILAEGADLPLLLPVKYIETDREKAARVSASVPKKIGRDARDFIRNAFLTCHPKKDLLILKFLKLGYRYGPSVMNRLTDDVVDALTKAVYHLEHEAHMYTGFIRFSEANGALTAEIEPKNIVLPLLAEHFCERFQNEQFLIYDKTHGMALIHQNREFAICAVEELELPAPGEEEMKFRALWRLFYDTIEIRERRNPRCRMSHMPKRFWGCLTEFAHEGLYTADKSPELPAPASGLRLEAGKDGVQRLF
jgi:probable DNA metabolism protein